MSAKQKFLLEHNKLSPPDLQVTEEMLSRFRIEKSVLLKNSDWSIDKLRRPLIIWLTSMSIQERKGM